MPGVKYKLWQLLLVACSPAIPWSVFFFFEGRLSSWWKKVSDTNFPKCCYDSRWPWDPALTHEVWGIMCVREWVGYCFFHDKRGEETPVRGPSVLSLLVEVVEMWSRELLQPFTWWLWTETSPTREDGLWWHYRAAEPSPGPPSSGLSHYDRENSPMASATRG